MSCQKKPPVCAGELVTTAKRVHPFPSRTRQLSSSALTILWGQPHGKIRRRHLTRPHGRFFIYYVDSITTLPLPSACPPSRVQKRDAYPPCFRLERSVVAEGDTKPHGSVSSISPLLVQCYWCCFCSIRWHDTEIREPARVGSIEGRERKSALDLPKEF
jgi:hypothetical protein